MVMSFRSILITSFLEPHVLQGLSGTPVERSGGSVIAAARSEGLFIRAWNPDTEADIQAMIDLRPDGISSNRPDRVLRLLGRSG